VFPAAVGATTFDVVIKEHPLAEDQPVGSGAPLDK
jgi:hypothetical protein